MGELADLDAVELRRLIGRKAVSPVELVTACERRIDETNGDVNAIVALDRDAAKRAAREREAALLRDEPLGPLHGIPVVLKDLHETAGLRTTYGSAAFAQHVPEHDEALVARLRAAGAIVLAKTNTPEFGAGANTTNAVYGATRNPYDTARTCGGSSGGSAVALACGMVPLATGSDMGGSLRIPASYCGVVGLRPSPGLVPSRRRALGRIALSVDGPMARSVRDVALLLSVLAAFDPYDPLAFPYDDAALAEIPDIDLARIRAGISEDLGFAPVAAAIREVFRERVARIAPAFARCEPVRPALDDAGTIFGVLRAEWFAASYGELERRFGATLGPNVRAELETARRHTFDDLVGAQVAHTALAQRFEALFETIDVLIAPTTALSPFPVERLFPLEIDGVPLERYYDWFALTYGLTLTEHPVISLPAGRDREGLPLGIQICGPRHGERLMLAVAAALERELAAE